MITIETIDKHIDNITNICTRTKMLPDNIKVACYSTMAALLANEVFFMAQELGYKPEELKNNK